MATKITDRIKAIRRRRRRSGEIKLQQQSAIRRGGAPDLRGTARLLRFQAQQQSVIRKELTPSQRQTLRRRGFSRAVVPQERAGKAAADFGKRTLAGAIGGAETKVATRFGRPRTQLSLKESRGLNAGLLRSLARHEISHQLNRKTTKIQHEQINLLGGTGGSVKKSRQFFRRFERINSPK